MMPIRLRVLLLMPTLVSCVSFRSAVQGPDVVQSVEMAAAEYAATYMYDSRPNARIALDTITASGPGRSAAETAALVRALRAVGVIAADSAITCGDLPSSCRIRGEVDSVVSIKPR